MKTLCVVPCGKRKIWDKEDKAKSGAAAAKDAYTGAYSRKCKEYAEIFYPRNWCILSAKYGFVFPEELIPGPYNVSFNDKKTCPITIDALVQQIRQKELDDVEKVVVLGGKSYSAIVEKAFQGKTIINPLANCRGLGYMMHKINEAIKDKKAL
ncbi:MAG: DUF6884 domain-containing protein [Methanothrix sp.]|jgi:hypothetical protein